MKWSNMSVIVHTIKTECLGFTNYSYIVQEACSHNAVIIDASWSLEVYDKVIQKYQLEPKMIMLTHSHFDHTNLVNELQEKYQLKVYMSELEATYYHYKCRNLNLLKNRDRVMVSQMMTISCYLTPGHTKGSMCYEVDGNLFTGDTLFFEGCGNVCARGGSPYEMFDSIQLIRANFADKEIIYPGHVYGKTVGQNLEDIKKNNAYFMLDEARSVRAMLRRR